MLTQLTTWFVISNTEKLKTKVYFDAPWSVTPNAHITTFAIYLNKLHLKCADFEVTILDAEKNIFFIGQMDLSGLFENDYLKDYYVTAEKSWKTTVDAFTK